VPTLERASLEVGNVRRVPDEKFRLSCGENQTRSRKRKARLTFAGLIASIFKQVFLSM
jgi:hypothetical protein